jgi:signal transduction histidine kinase
MKKIVFTKAPQMDAREERIAELHSVLNILNVLVGELSLVDMVLPDEEQAVVFERFADELTLIARDMQELDDVPGILSRVRDSEVGVLKALHDLLQVEQDAGILSDVRESLSNIESVYGIVCQRLDEIEVRIDNLDVWVSLSTQKFDDQFREVFYAIEKNAKGRYRIFFNLARKSKRDYYIDLKIESSLQPGMLWIPMRLMDVIRDLAANARKYTEPGGQVALAIYQDAVEIRVLIEDSGCGIPEDEIERVVECGYRATNVRDRPTMGGGFGLTKAAWLVDQWGGSLSIESAVDEGTSVRIVVPNRELPSRLETSTNARPC